ncbi:chymotrypsin-like elastase family member 3B [Hippocampus zosterae]|uniref:chymotrypsin-like elastase family member 3B n=1 Tax=Hippocampus zosterae TaxID=109293 RepID=UPI00223CBC79|nr:chymotrypsin-like elastase family member 3B [Hippocampus zosterae]
MAVVLGCGTPAVQPNTNRVVNGEDARPHSWPWQVKATPFIRHGPMPAKLQQALLPVVQHSNWENPTNEGDSGGPLNCQGEDGRWYVQGVTSFVSSQVCNEAKKPTIFTRTSAFAQWLSEVVLRY